MALQIVASMGTLMRLARLESRARLSGNEAAYKKAKQQHEAYKQVCLEADQLLLHETIGSISNLQSQ